MNYSEHIENARMNTEKIIQKRKHPQRKKSKFMIYLLMTISYGIIALILFAIAYLVRYLYETF